MNRSLSPDAVPNDDVVKYYQRRAAADVGLIITEGTTINHKVASMNAQIPQFHGEAALAGWQKVVSAVHAEGGAIIPQLWHTGSARRASESPNPDCESMGPSGLVAPGVKKILTMTQADIDEVIAAFADAALAAKQLGFDGIELHGAHGYLIDQFFWEGTNQRDDKYGGSLLKRTRFAVEILEAVRDKVGEDFFISLRISQWKQQDYNARLAPDQRSLQSFLEPLCAAGVDLFHCSQRRFWEPEFEGSAMNLAGWVKELTGKPTMSVGSVGLSGEFIAAFLGESSEKTSLDQLFQWMERDEFDMISVGRALLQDAQWAKKVKEERYDEIGAFDPASLGSLN